jgi:hypothetical protein
MEATDLGMDEEVNKLRKPALRVLVSLQRTGQFSERTTICYTTPLAT